MLSNLVDIVAITEAARRLGVRLVVTEPDRALERIRDETPALIVLDLTNASAIGLIERLSQERVPTLGYYPHVDQALRERAMRAGLARAVPRSAFFGRLAEMLSPAARLPEPPAGC